MRAPCAANTPASSGNLLRRPATIDPRRGDRWRSREPRSTASNDRVAASRSKKVSRSAGSDPPTRKWVPLRPPSILTRTPRLPALTRVRILTPHRDSCSHCVRASRVVNQRSSKGNGALSDSRRLCRPRHRTASRGRMPEVGRSEAAEMRQ